MRGNDDVHRLAGDKEAVVEREVRRAGDGRLQGDVGVRDEGVGDVEVDVDAVGGRIRRQVRPVHVAGHDGRGVAAALRRTEADNRPGLERRVARPWMDLEFARRDGGGLHGRGRVDKNEGRLSVGGVRDALQIRAARRFGDDARRGGQGDVRRGGLRGRRRSGEEIPRSVGDGAIRVGVGRGGDIVSHRETGIVERALVLLHDEDLHARGVVGVGGSRTARVVADGEPDFRPRRHVANRHLEIEALRAVGNPFKRDDAAREDVVLAQRDGDGRAGAGGGRRLLACVMEGGEGGVPAVFGGGEAQDHVGVSGLSGMEHHLVDTDGVSVEDAARLGHERRIRQRMVGDVHLQMRRRGSAPALKLVVVGFGVGRREVAERSEWRDAGGAAVCPDAAVFVRVGIRRRRVVLEILPQRLAGIVDRAGGGRERDERADREKHRAKYGAAQNGTKNGAA